jgi:hypothetical protein
VDRGLLDLPIHVQFVLGVMGANAATIDQFMHMRRTATDLFGENLTWSAAGVGYPAEYHLAAMCLMLGGHGIRVGLEDNLRVSRQKRAESNASSSRRPSPSPPCSTASPPPPTRPARPSVSRDAPPSPSRADRPGGSACERPRPAARLKVSSGIRRMPRTWAERCGGSSRAFGFRAGERKPRPGRRGFGIPVA